MLRNMRIIIFFFPVILGGFIYITFRTNNLLMFNWFENLGLSNEIIFIRNLKNNFSFPNWVIYNLPDGLWLFSYTAILLEIWDYLIDKKTFFWIFSIPLAAILSEILQLFKIIPGTFDLTDIGFYLLGTIIPFYLLPKIIFNTKKNEKL